MFKETTRNKSLLYISTILIENISFFNHIFQKFLVLSNFAYALFPNFLNVYTIYNCLISFINICVENSS